MSSAEARKEPAPTLQGRYRLVRTLEVSDFGATFLAYDSRLTRWRAIDVAADQEAGRRLIREAEVVARLDHPSVERVLDMGDDGPVSFVVREFLHGSLANHLPVAPALAGRVVLDVADGLAHAHSRNVMHGHLRPSVIRFSDEGKPVIVGFGRQAVAEGANTTARAAEPWAHMAPELRRTFVPDVRSDVYALAALLYTLVAGRHQADLFYAEAYDGLMTPIPTALRPVIVRGCSYDRNERPERAQDFRDLLASRLELLGSTPEVPWRAEPPPAKVPEFIQPDGQLLILMNILGRPPLQARATEVDGGDSASTMDSGKQSKYTMPELLRKDPGFRDPFEHVDAKDLPTYVDPTQTPAMRPRRPVRFTVGAHGSRDATPPPSMLRTTAPLIGGVLGVFSVVGFLGLLLAALFSGYLLMQGRADDQFVTAVLAEHPSVEIIAVASPNRAGVEEAWFRLVDDPTPDHAEAFVVLATEAATATTAPEEARKAAARLATAQSRWR